MEHKTFSARPSTLKFQVNFRRIFWVQKKGVFDMGVFQVSKKRCIVTWVFFIVGLWLELLCLLFVPNI